jgi:hypothetical protein
MLLSLLPPRSPPRYASSMSQAAPISVPLPEGFSIRKAIHCARLVDVAYDLYGLTPDEIALVEESSKG